MTVHGTVPLCQRLKCDAVPTRFEWEKSLSTSVNDRLTRLNRRRSKNLISSSSLPDEVVPDIGSEISISEEPDQPMEHISVPDEPVYNATGSQTDSRSMFSIERIKNEPAKILHYSGLESYAKFQLVLHSLGPAAYHLKYYSHHVRNVSVEDQLFLVLVKFRLNGTNFVIADLFEICESTVSNIIITWINFMYLQWKELDTWAAQELIRFYTPSDFKVKFPTTRVIVDGTECPVQKPKTSLAQQATFSTYKNRNTIKVLVGASPGGLVTFVSDAYGGSASDRQISERSNLCQKCDPGDSIMSDKGFNVQDLFAPYDVKINIPAFFSKKNRLDGKTVQSDRAISSKRVHIERIIGLAKTFKILKVPMNSTSTLLATEIISICFMLCNFKDCIVSRNA